MGGLFDRLRAKHTPAEGVPPALPLGTKPPPILAANGIRNLILSQDVRPPGMSALVASIVGHALGEPVGFTETPFGRRYLFCDQDSKMYEVLCLGGHWVVHKKGTAGPRTDEIPQAARGFEVTWSTQVDDVVQAMEKLLTTVLTQYYEPPKDLRFQSKQVEWGHGIERYHWTSNRGALHLHRKQEHELDEMVVQIDSVAVCLQFHPTSDGTGYRLVGQPAQPPF